VYYGTLCYASHQQVWVEIDSRKGGLDIIVACVAIIFRIGDGQAQMQNAKLVEQICEVECCFVHFADPNIDSVSSWPWAKATVGYWARLSSVM
jgi:hypothetical protein